MLIQKRYTVSQLFLQVHDKSRALGRHVTKVIENSRMHHVVKSGQEEIADIQYSNASIVWAIGAKIGSIH